MFDQASPLCFVLMPYGTKSNDGTLIDFDVLYAQVFRPAVEAAGLHPIRADEEQVGGIIHKPMFERLILCEYAVADLTWANANVYYELGVRHAVRPYSTVLTFAQGSRLPFDLGPLRAVPYQLDPAGRPARIEDDRDALAGSLRAARRKATDSPVFQLIDALPVPDVSRLKTDVFRERVEYSTRVQERLAAARTDGAEAIRAVEQDIGQLQDAESGVLVDLLLSYRAVSAHVEMIRLVEALPEPVARATLVREQYALALNRIGRGEHAERVLHALMAERGPSSEAYGLLGRIYKDRWDQARAQGRTVLARGLLDQAIDAYLAGFDCDWRDQYPGINAVQLMTLRDPPDPRVADLLPVVRYSLNRRIASGLADYWDWATLLELAAIGDDPAAAAEALPHALAAVREPWEPASTQATIRRLREVRQQRGQPADWLVEVEQALDVPARPQTA
jgi:MAP3K TRAFs-binding domain